MFQEIGRFRVLEQLGQGAMATVYKAYDPQIDRELAIKVLRAAGEKFLGLKAVLAQKPEDRATAEEKPAQSIQRVVATDGKLWHDAIVRLKQFRLEYGEALGRFLSGLRTTPFPAGTYKLHAQLGFECEPAG